MMNGKVYYCPVREHQPTYEEHTAHCSMWMLCSRLQQSSSTMDIYIICSLLYPIYMCINICVKIASNVIIIYLKGLKSINGFSIYKNIQIDANITNIE